MLILQKLLASGKVQERIECNDADYLMRVIRSAANSEFPDFKEWRFKKKEGYILAIKKEFISIPAPVIEVNDNPLDFFGVLGILIDGNENIDFTNATINDDELNNLKEFCESKGINLEIDNGRIRCRKLSM